MSTSRSPRRYLYRLSPFLPESMGSSSKISLSFGFGSRWHRHTPSDDSTPTSLFRLYGWYLYREDCVKVFVPSSSVSPSSVCPLPEVLYPFRRGPTTLRLSVQTYLGWDPTGRRRVPPKSSVRSTSFLRLVRSLVWNPLVHTGPPLGGSSYPLRTVTPTPRLPDTVRSLGVVSNSSPHRSRLDTDVFGESIVVRDPVS